MINQSRLSNPCPRLNERTTNMEEETYLLEINLISAQGLKPPSSNIRRLQTYAISWVDPAFKLRTRIDSIGGENPTWNDKFFFRVSSAFLSNLTSAVTVQIYAVAYLKDPLIGSVRFLIGNALSAGNTTVSAGIPSFSAFQIRRSSGRFQGVLNIGAMLINGSEFATSFTGVSAIGYRDLMGEDCRKHRRHRKKKAKGEENSSSCETNNSLERGDSNSDADSTCSSTSTRSTVLSDWNGRRGNLAGKKERSDGVGGMILCALGFQRKSSAHLTTPSDENLQISDER